MELLIIGFIVMGVVAFGGLLLWVVVNSQRRAGQLEERDAQNRASEEAIQRANDVLAEHRDVDSTADKLRKHEF